MCSPPQRAVSLLHEPAGTPAGTFGLAGAWFHDAQGCVTASGDGEDLDVHGGGALENGLKGEPSSPLTCSSEGTTDSG